MWCWLFPRRVGTPETDVAGVARTAGDANAGMFDADRIVNASVQLKPAARNYFDSQ